MDLSVAVKKTIAYSAYFNFPLSPSELHFWLISSRPVSPKSISNYLPSLKPKELKLKATLLKNTRQKEALAGKLIKIARFIPGIRLIALTGSVAANNSQKKDDLDLLIVTSAHSLWLVRPIFLLMLSLFFNRRHPGDNPSQIKNVFCPNLWLDTLSFAVPKKRRNLYTAHEVLQIKPLLDKGNTYRRFLQANHWTKHFLANAYSALSGEKIKKQKPTIINYLFLPLNYLLFIFQYLYMLPKITTETVSLHSAFFHKNDLSVTLANHLKNNSL
jgi:hypothetical protein